jgi:hypothetical protein
MVERIGNFILELVAAPGTGNFVLGTPVQGRLPWSAGVAAGYFVAPAQVLYFANDTTRQEWGIGTYTTGSLTRDTVLWTSAGSTAKINFNTLPVYVYPEIPAERSVYRDPSTGRLKVPYDISSPQQNLGPLAGHRNRLINSGFQCNQNGYISGSNNVAAFQYTAFDRWRTGQNGWTLTFTATKPATTVTVTQGTMQQVIDGTFIEGGTYVLSWQGTATARVNTGAYSTSPLVCTGATSITAGANTTIEFNTGSVLKPQFEPGDTASQWEVRFDDQALCERYLVQGQFRFSGYGLAGMVAEHMINLPTLMRATPNVFIGVGSCTNCGAANTIAALSARDLKLSTAVVAAGYYTFLGSYTAIIEL